VRQRHGAPGQAGDTRVVVELEQSAIVRAVERAQGRQRSGLFCRVPAETKLDELLALIDGAVKDG
jgi:hypothetical protein